MNEDTLTKWILLGMFAFLTACVIFMLAVLKSILKKTLYRYTNIMLVGGILFVSVMAVSVLNCYISALFTKDLSLKFVCKFILDYPRTFSYYAVFALSVVCVLIGISNIELMRHEGFRIRNASSLFIAVLYIGGTAVIYLVSDFVETKLSDLRPWMIWINTSFPLFCLLMLCYFECVLVGTAVMGYKAAKQVPKYDKDYIIILGCSIDKKGGLLPLLKGRVNRAVRYAWEQEIASGKPLKYVPSGGQGANEVMSEGSAMELYLLTKGAESYEVFPEKKSTNTFENISFSKKIIDELCPDAKIAFATTNYHILRSGIIARKLGIDAEGIAGDTKWYFWPNGFIREFFGILMLHIKAHIIALAVIFTVSVLLGFISSYGLL